MANEITTARTRIKTKLDISDTTFDSMLLECIEQAVPRLAPFLQYKMAEDTTVTLAVDDDSFSLPDSTSTLDKLYSRTSVNESWRLIDLWIQRRDTVYLHEQINSVTYLKIFASRPFGYSDAELALLEADYPSAMLPLYLFAMAEFATMLVGNKRKFNIYQQSNGVRTLDEMQQLVATYENRAMSILENEISAEGH